MSESVPSSVTGFAHRRPRADSLASFTYFQEDDESPEWSEEQAVLDEEEDDSEFSKQGEDDLDRDLESGSTSPQRRKSSGLSRASVEYPLLHRRGSSKSGAYFDGAARHSQKIYVVTEDLTIVVAGFSTKTIGFMLYLGLCIFTGGLGYLILRWLPRWRVRLVGSLTALRDCDWVVIEVRSPHRSRKPRLAAEKGQNQWGELMVQNVVNLPYGHAASTVFGQSAKKAYSLYDENDDPVMSQLCLLDYRYIRFCYHPATDKFTLCSNWKDPDWTSVRSMRNGLDSDERHRREQVFGMNQIDLEQKSIPQLLVDEVSASPFDENNGGLTSYRHSIRSTYSRSRALFFGLLTNTTIMPSASFSSQLLALRLLSLKRDRYGNRTSYNQDAYR